MKRIFRPLSSLVLVALLFTVGAGCTGSSTTTAPAQVDLTIWRVFDDDDTFDAIINAYEALHPNVNIEYKKLRYDEYPTELVRAFAAGQGPDIFSVHNTWIGEYMDLMQPMPSSVTVTNQETQGTVSRKIIYVQKQSPTMSVRELESTYVEQVALDVVRDYQATKNATVESRIFGLPLSVDSMVLFYNKDLFNSAGIATPPTTWSEFQSAVIKLTQYDSSGEITQSGAAMGLGDNVERSADILSLLMMQNGTSMTDDRGRVTFNLIPDGLADDVNPGLDAVRFYTDFANPTKEVYTWNDSYTNSFDAFTTGQTAMMLGYSYYMPLIRTAAPKLNWSVSSVPQVEGRVVNLANYWVESVAKSTKNSNYAWDFLLFATDEAQVPSYLASANKPTALRALIGEELEDAEMSIFAKQTLTAKSWYLGSDINATEEALRSLITQILNGSVEPEKAMSSAVQKVNQTF